MSTKLPFPTPIEQNGRKYFLRHVWENYKRQLAGLPLLDESRVTCVEFVPTKQAARELGQTRRTVGRRMRLAALEGRDEGAAA
jgi:hypothetical protein